MSDVRAQLRESDGMDGDRPGRFVRVILYSRKSVPGQPLGRHKSHVDLYPEDYGSEDDFKRAVEVSGGALAEYQCESYGDRHDPEQCARAAVEAYEQLRGDMEARRVERGLEGRSER